MRFITSAPALAVLENIIGKMVKTKHATASYTMALLADGTLSTWGKGLLNPTPVAGINSVTQVAASSSHVCALLTDQTVSCWGTNTFGQLGDGTKISRNNPAAVTGLTQVLKVVTSTNSSCALLANGSVHCWGDNLSGQLGNGRAGSNWELTTAENAVTDIGNAIDVALADDHACALLNDGTVTCWGAGAGEWGQISLWPLLRTGLSDVTSIVAGAKFTCALTSAGIVYCWGYDNYGELGHGVVRDTQYVTDPVIGLNGATALFAGPNQACATIAGGAVKCWGKNTHAQLGDHTKANQSTAVSAQDLANVIGIGIGNYHQCDLFGNGSVSCLGDSYEGQFGDAQPSIRKVPAQVQDI